MELDHVFVFTQPDGPDISALRGIGLTETYWRTHPGQGTANVCFAFDNLFLECLWIADAAAASSAAIARTGLFERSRWRTDGTNPFGLAWRDGEGPPFDGPTWTCCLPYLPEGLTIEVATDSDDPRQPMLFRSPGNTAPAHWPAERRGALQRSAGLGRVSAVELHMPHHVPPCAARRTLATSTRVLRTAAGEGFSMRLTVERADGADPLAITLPSFTA